MPFQNPADEETLVKVFRAFVQEWGPENVTVLVPRHWESFAPTFRGKLRIDFGDDSGVSVRVVYGKVRITYSQPFKPS
jgi:hypothetical protein